MNASKPTEVWVHYELNAALYATYSQHTDPVTQCHIWSGSQNNCGYGLFRARDLRDHKWRMVTPHRIALTVKLGRPIHPGLQAHHGCHNRLCVNPDHLSEGTQAEKIAQMVTDHRMNHHHRSSGPRHKPQANRVYQYTAEQILWIRSADISDIQTQYQITRNQASRLRARMRTGYTWCRSTDT